MERPDTLSRAVRWISDRRLDGDGRALHVLLDEAARRFDLSPKEEAGLLALLRGGEEAASSGSDEG